MSMSVDKLIIYRTFLRFTVSIKEDLIFYNQNRPLPVPTIQSRNLKAIITKNPRQNLPEMDACEEDLTDALVPLSRNWGVEVWGRMDRVAISNFYLFY